MFPKTSGERRDKERRNWPKPVHLASERKRPVQDLATCPSLTSGARHGIPLRAVAWRGRARHQPAGQKSQPSLLANVRLRRGQPCRHEPVQSLPFEGIRPTIRLGARTGSSCSILFHAKPPAFRAIRRGGGPCTPPADPV